MRLLSRENFAAVIAVALASIAMVVFVSRNSADDPVPAASAPPPSTATATAPPPLMEPGAAGAVTTKRPAPVRASPDANATVLSTLRAGITLPVTNRQGTFLEVLTPCEASGWVDVTDVDIHPRASGEPGRLGEATIVIDPGHGGQQTGAVGPTGLRESEPNADIAGRLVSKLQAAGARAFSTRSGDYVAGLTFRSALANSLGAHVFLSIHNNADPDGPSSKPGTETYFQYRSPDSRRLSGLAYEEVVRALTPFPADWVADRDAGAKYRLNPEQADYYGLLRGSRVPAVLVEAMFVSNPSEEALLRRDDVREAIAVALAASLRRYFETEDPGSGFIEPYPREPGPSGRLPSVCNEPGP